MEPRFPHFVRADGADPIRHWANLEGKSDSMRDDLFREHSTREELPIEKKKFPFAVVFEIAATIFELWRHGRS